MEEKHSIDKLLGLSSSRTDSPRSLNSPSSVNTVQSLNSSDRSVSTAVTNEATKRDRKLQRRHKPRKSTEHTPAALPGKIK